MHTYSPFKFLLGVLGLLHNSTQPDNTCPAQLAVIGAGLSKTGTQSTKLAFETLGYKVYNVESMMYHGHLPLVTAIHQAETQEAKAAHVQALNAAILDTQASVVLDIPCNFLFEELYALNPQAQVLLTVRDTPQKWTQSIQKTFHAFAPLVSWPFSWFFDLETYSRQMWLSECDHGIDIWEPWFFPWVKIAHRYFMTDEAKCRQMYINHNTRVMQTIPQDHLLVYNVKEGWDPLLRMLNLTVTDKGAFPKFPKFPQVNKGADMDAVAFFTRLIAYGYPFLAFGVVLVAAYATFLGMFIFAWVLLHICNCIWQEEDYFA